MSHDNKYTLSEYDYYLPEELIAQEPLQERDRSRLMVVKPENNKRENVFFRDLPDFLNAGDLLILNNTRVIPARLIGFKKETGGTVEVLLLRKTNNGNNTWEAMVKPGKRALPGQLIRFENGVEGFVEKINDNGYRLISFNNNIFSDNDDTLFSIGKVPLPPYIKKAVDDPEKYQTIYSKVYGSVAAPTAGFHFTEEVFANLEKKGVKKAFITLHIGPGTFTPVKKTDIREHIMHEEYYEISRETAEDINKARKAGNRVIAVGTTSCRVLESRVTEEGIIKHGSGLTGIFIYPGFKFRCIDGMITNFHLPRSTLFMLVSALAGTDFMKESYTDAVKKRYRFFSFGDAMLII